MKFCSDSGYGFRLSLRSAGMTALLQLQIPELADHRTAPTPVSFRARETKACFLINVTRGGEYAVSPQRDLLVAGAARKANAFVDKVCADPQPFSCALTIA